MGVNIHQFAMTVETVTARHNPAGGGAAAEEGGGGGEGTFMNCIQRVMTAESVTDCLQVSSSS